MAENDDKNKKPENGQREPLIVDVPTALRLVHDQIRLEAKDTKRTDPPHGQGPRDKQRLD